MNCRVATCPHANCDWQQTRKDGRVVCAFLSEAKCPCEYRMTKNMYVKSDIQKGSSGYIIHTSSGVMKLGPRKTLQSPLYSGRVSDSAYKEADYRKKYENQKHGGPVAQGFLWSYTGTRNLTSANGKGLYMHGQTV